MKITNQKLRVIFFIVSFVIVGAFISSLFKSGRDELATKNVLLKIAAQLNQKLPMMIDDETRFDLVETGPGKLITLNYSFIRKDKIDIDIPRIKLTVTFNFLAMNSNIFSDQLKAFRDHYVEIRFRFRDQHGNQITDIVLTPKDY